jgi:hypothetical protein
MTNPINNIFNHIETGAFETRITRRAGISILTIVCSAIFIHMMQERLRFHMLKQRDTVMSFRYASFGRLENLIMDHTKIMRQFLNIAAGMNATWNAFHQTLQLLLRTWACMWGELALQNLYSQKIATDIGVDSARLTLLCIFIGYLRAMFLMSFSGVG